MAETKKGIGIRVKTWVERDKLGWYCVVGFWTSDMPHPDSEPDDAMRVGTWDTHAEADAELKGDFRDLVMEAVKNLVGENGGFIIDGKTIDAGKVPES